MNKDKILGRCSECGAKLYVDQDGYIHQTINSGGEWFKAKSPWELDERWYHTCNPYEQSRHGCLVMGDDNE